MNLSQPFRIYLNLSGPFQANLNISEPIQINLKLSNFQWLINVLVYVEIENNFFHQQQLHLGVYCYGTDVGVFQRLAISS